MHQSLDFSSLLLAACIAQRVSHSRYICFLQAASPSPTPLAGTCYASTIAGTGSAGPSIGDGGPARLATLQSPSGIAVISGSGDIVIASQAQHVVRIVLAATGDIATFAGNGVSANSGDGGAAAAASMRSPYGLVSLSDSSVLIADTKSNRVRVVWSDNTIGTWMGNGTAGMSANGIHRSQAMVNRPWKLSFDASSGDVFVTESDTGQIWQVNGATGIVSLFVGPPGSNATVTLLLSQPHDVLVLPNATGSYIVSSSAGSRVFLVNTVARNAMLLAGTGSATEYSADGAAAALSAVPKASGLLFHAASRSIFVADSGAGRLRAFSIGGNMLTFAGNGTNNVSLIEPSALAWHSSGAVLVSEYSGHRVQAISAACLPTAAPVSLVRMYSIIL